MNSKQTLATIALISISVGVLAALLQAAEEPPTELYVRTTPAGATLFLDGKKLGTTPDIFEVAPGKHELLVVLEGYESAKLDIDVRATRIKRVIVSLKSMQALVAEGESTTIVDHDDAHLGEELAKTLFLPDVETPGVNVALDLASGEILPIADPSEFARMGKGDFVYDDAQGRGIACLRGATAMIWHKDHFTPLESARQLGDVTGYKLPTVPCRLLVTTATKRQFDVTVLSETKDGGIVLEYHAVAEAPEKSAAGVTDQERLQAAWKVLSVKKNGDTLPDIDGKYVFHSDRFQIFDNGQEAVSGTYHIDTSRNPKTIDLHSVSQPEFPTLMGIFDFPSAGRMRICYSDKQAWRPTSFDPKQDEGNVAVLELRLETNDIPETPNDADRPVVIPTTSDKGKGSNQAAREVHLPNAEGGPEAQVADLLGVKFILDLAGGQTLAFPDDAIKAPGRSGQFLANLKRGDLFYAARSLFCLRGAKAMQWDGNRFAPLQPGDFAASENAPPPSLTRYHLAKVPCRLLITTAERRQFDVTIVEITDHDGGIDLEYREVDSKGYRGRAIGEAQL